MTLFVTALHVLVCVVLIVVVLLQRGKGADIGAVFGGGGGSTVFGSRGAGNFLTRLTTGAAIIFMVTSLTLAYFAQDSTRSTLFEGEEEAAAQAPAGAEPDAAGETSPFQEVETQPVEPSSAEEEPAEAPAAPAPDPGAP